MLFSTVYSVHASVHSINCHQTNAKAVKLPVKDATLRKTVSNANRVTFKIVASVHHVSKTVNLVLMERLVMLVSKVSHIK